MLQTARYPITITLSSSTWCRAGILPSDFVVLPDLAQVPSPLRSWPYPASLGEVPSSFFPSHLSIKVVPVYNLLDSNTPPCLLDCKHHENKNALFGFLFPEAIQLLDSE